MHQNFNGNVGKGRGVVGSIVVMLLFGGYICTVTAATTATATPSTVTTSPTLPLRSAHHHNSDFRVDVGGVGAGGGTAGGGTSRLPFEVSMLASTAANNCNCSALLKKIHERLGFLTTLEQMQQNRLEDIDVRIIDLEKNHLRRVNNFVEQQRNTQRKNIERAEQQIHNSNTHSNNNINNHHHNNRYRNSSNLNRVHGAESSRRNANETSIPVPRWTRQTAAAPYPPQQSPIPSPVPGTFLNDAQKLDSLATLLLSTRAALRDLQMDLQTNFSKLAQQSGLLQRRINNVLKQQPQQTPLFTGGLQSFGVMRDTPNCMDVDPNHNQGLLRWWHPSTSSGTRRADQMGFYVRCDNIETWGNGWLLVLNRFNGDINFERSWSEYRRGFGNIAGEFFIGLERLHAITASMLHELLIVLENFEGEQRFAHYRTFAIGSESDDYELQVLGEYDGDAGDSLSYHAGYKFSTFDNDNDGCVDCNCAQSHRGGWWYNWCDQSNLMGPYHAEDYDRIEQYRGVYWQHWLGPNYSLRAVKMLIRPVNQEVFA